VSKLKQNINQKIKKLKNEKPYLCGSSATGSSVPAPATDATDAEKTSVVANTPYRNAYYR
jgi:hypothetical protein